MANSTSMQIFMVSLVIDDYDSAIEHYTKDWCFELLEDSLGEALGQSCSSWEFMLFIVGTSQGLYPKSRHWPTSRRTGFPVYACL
jgi:hypothetical protein